MKSFLTVFKFEYFNVVKSKIFIGITLAFIILVGGFLSITSMIKSDDGLLSSLNTPSVTDDAKKENVLIIDKNGFISDLKTFSTAFPEYNFIQDNKFNKKNIKESINNGDYAFIFEVEDGLNATLYQKKSDLSGIEISFQEVYGLEYKNYILKSYNLTDEQIAVASATPTVTLSETDKSTIDTYFYTYFLLMLLYMSVILYGQMVASAVASEKSNRSMELLITSAKPNSLLFGKILGCGLAGLSQILVIIISSIGFYKLNEGYWKTNAIVKALFDMPADIMVYTIVFFILGFFSYAALFGALGSMVSRVEDINTASMPLTLLYVAAFMISITGMTTPDSLIIKVFSFVPFFSQSTMFVRLCVTTVPTIEIVISILILVLTCIGTAFISAKIYRIGTLTYGKTPNLKTIVEVLSADKKKSRN